jgi:hypothetical protein
MPSTTARPRHNPDARDPADVLGTSLPDTVSAASWKRPYCYFVVRTDEGRLSRLDDHEDGRIIVHGFPTRHNAVGHKALCERHGSGEYIVGYEENDHYED